VSSKLGRHYWRNPPVMLDAALLDAGTPDEAVRPLADDGATVYVTDGGDAVPADVAALFGKPSG
jgi:hypothetical protein